MIKQLLTKSLVVLMVGFALSSAAHAAVHGAEEHVDESGMCEWGTLLLPLSHGVFSALPEFDKPLALPLAMLMPPACYVPDVRQVSLPQNRDPPARSTLR